MDEQTVVRAQQGDRAAFADLVDGVGDRLHAVAQGILRQRDVAEDAAQQALVQIWRDLPQLRDPARFEAWALRILVRCSYAEARSARRQLRAVAATSRSDIVVADGTGLVLDRDQLERAFRRLKVEQRSIIVLRHYLQLPLEQIADALDVPVDTARSRLYHSMRALRAAIEADLRNVGPAPVQGQVEP